MVLESVRYRHLMFSLLRQYPGHQFLGKCTVRYGHLQICLPRQGIRPEISQLTPWVCPRIYDRGSWSRVEWPLDSTEISSVSHC
jgi:hypothetical protein